MYNEKSQTELFNPEIERYFLGSCFVDPKVYEDSILSTTDFGTVDHQLIYAAIATVYEECRSSDPVLIADRLKKDGEINRVDGSNIIYEMQTVVVETESAAGVCQRNQKAFDEAEDRWYAGSVACEGEGTRLRS